jgi:hypothetical protein
MSASSCYQKKSSTALHRLNHICCFLIGVASDVSGAMAAQSIPNTARSMTAAEQVRHKMSSCIHACLIFFIKIWNIIDCHF